VADDTIINTTVQSAPKDYVIPGTQELLLKTVRAVVNGSAASAAYLPAVQLLAPDGTVCWSAVPNESVAAGASADVSWFPGVNEEPISDGTGGGGTISKITSNAASLAVTDPTGPTTNLDLPASGVTAGTYGDSGHVSQVTVNADGIVTSASNVAVAGPPAGMVNIFDQTLGIAAASIDTGVGGVASGYSGLMILAVGRAANAVFSGSFNLIFNNDTGANYQYIWTDNSNGVSSSFITTAQTAAKIMEGPGSSIGAGIFGVAHVTIPAYTDTTADKAITSLGGFAETSGHSELVHLVGTWNNTAAITRIAFTTGIGNLVAGSRLTIYGLP